MDAGRRNQLIDELADRLRRWGLTGPGIIFFETNKPFSFLGSQLILFLQPVLSTFIASSVVAEYATLLEDRANVERLIQRLESEVNDAQLGDASWK